MNRVEQIDNPTRRVYAAMAVALDDGVGQLLQTLQAQNILNNTLRFFLSDNGAESGGGGNNGPFRGFKFNTLEGGIRVPFAIQWPARLPGQITYTQPISALDIVATAAAAARVQQPTDRPYDGVDMMPFLTGQQTSPQRTLFWRVLGLGPTGPPGSIGTIWAVRNGPLKLVTEKDTLNQLPALYNLPLDLGEHQNLAASQPDDVASLNTLYAQWSTKLISPLWWKNSNGPVVNQLISLDIAGDWNGFNVNDTTPPWQLTAVSAPDINGTPDAFDWLINTIHVATVGGDTTPGPHSFNLVGNNNLSSQWGGATVNIDNTTTILSFSGTTLGPVNNISFDDGFY